MQATVKEFAINEETGFVLPPLSRRLYDNSVVTFCGSWQGWAWDDAANHPLGMLGCSLSRE